MDPLLVLGLVGISFLVGILASMLGIGGGSLLVPFQTLVIMIPIRDAVGASLVSIIAGSVGASSVYIKRGLVNIKLGMLLELLAVVGAATGAWLVVFIDTRILTGLFGVLLTFTSLNMLLRRDQTAAARHLPPIESSHTTRFSGSYFDDSLGVKVHYTPRNLRVGIAASFAAGNASGLLGIGGGIVKVPVMALIMKIPIKVAAATSSFMVGITASAGSYIYYSRGLIDPTIAAPLALGMFLGSLVGSSTMPRIRSMVMRRLFAAVLMYAAVQMLLKSAGIGIRTAGG